MKNNRELCRSQLDATTRDFRGTTDWVGTPDISHDYPNIIPVLNNVEAYK
jgi:hypothetical protein